MTTGLHGALEAMRGALDHYAAERTPADDGLVERLRKEAESHPAWARVSASCSLSPFETLSLLLCAVVETDAAAAARVAEIQGAGRPLPTFGLAAAVLPGVHWSAFAPGGPLRRLGLLEAAPGHPLPSAPVRVGERVLTVLLGDQSDSPPDDHLEALSRAPLPPSLEAIAKQLAAAAMERPPAGAPPAFQLVGADRSVLRAVAALAAAMLGLPAWVLACARRPEAGEPTHSLVRSWEREALLADGLLAVEVDDSPEPGRRDALLARLLEGTAGVLVLLGRDPVDGGARSIVRYQVGRPNALEQRNAWRSLLGPRHEALAEELVGQFDLGLDGMGAALAAARGDLSATDDGEGEPDDARLADALWRQCRGLSRPRLGELAERIESGARFDDLVLPDATLAQLRAILSRVRHRATVLHEWGFSRLHGRGTGITVLFCGASGTGKTFAAEVLARSLRLDLYRVDLSATVSKYIGETEKNLRRVFDAAEDSGAVLLFDEADALFGRRSDVKDSHDRYANLEVSYLLQRMEGYRGLALLTTNLPESLDAAFQRRLHYIVRFPFPEAPARARIWTRIFPADAPTDGLDPDKLARLNVSGGAIRNIAVAAAYLAAEQGRRIGMTHVLAAARAEYAKLDQPLTESEVRGWT